MFNTTLVEPSAYRHFVETGRTGHRLHAVLRAAERGDAKTIGDFARNEQAGAMDLVWPDRQYLPGYVDALRRGWSPDEHRADARRFEELARIEKDADGFVRQQVDREATGPPVTLPDNSMVPRLPGCSLWMWDGEFCGSIGLRWQPGTEELPPYCLGHIGYSVVPWKRRRGYATRALQLLLPYARAEGLAYVELTTDAGNVASRRVIEANGGILIERFHKPVAYGGAEALRFRIALTAQDGSVGVG